MQTLHTLAININGRIIGNAQHLIKCPGKIETATQQEITFFANEKYASYLDLTNAGAIIISKNKFDNIVPKKSINYVVVDDAYAAFTKVLEYYAQQKLTTDLDTKIGTNTKIYPNVYIGKNVTIGNDCIIYANVSIYDDTEIGSRCIIHSGAVIGSDGFGFIPQNEGSFQKIPQLGNVIIEDDCEIGANTCVDRATIGSTIIRKGVKLDNLIQVAHNVEIGEHTVIAAQTGISGSTKIGHHNMIGGQVGFVGHIVVAPYTKINAQSAIAQNIKKEGLVLCGTPAFDMRQYFKSSVVFKSLPELEKRIRELENTISILKNKEKNHN